MNVAKATETPDMTYCFETSAFHVIRTLNARIYSSTATKEKATNLDRYKELSRRLEPILVFKCIDSLKALI